MVVAACPMVPPRAEDRRCEALRYSPQPRPDGRLRGSGV